MHLCEGPDQGRTTDRHRPQQYSNLRPLCHKACALPLLVLHTQIPTCICNHTHACTHPNAHTGTPNTFKNQPLPFFRRPLFAFLDRLFSPTNDRCCCLILSLRLCNLLVFLELFRVPHSCCYRILFHILGGGGTLCLTPKVGRYFYCIYC